MQAYQELEARFKRISGLSGASAILGWDQAVMMPKGGNEARGEQLAVLNGLAHEMTTASETADLIDNACQEQLETWQQRNLQEISRTYKRATALDNQLVEAMTRATNACEMKWRDARANDDFAGFAPSLNEVVELTKESAERLGEVLDLKSYDALLEKFQPGLKREDIDRLFEPLSERLPGMIDNVLAKQTPALTPTGPFPIEKQRELAKALMSQIGFDFDHGRLDESTHPFCGGVPGDHRITTRYNEDEIVSSLMGVLHETGHALYEAGLPKAWTSQPVGHASGMAAHESQSLLVEMQACRSRHFLAYLSKQLVEAFGAQPALEVDNLTRLYTKVERGVIRVDADELTYPLHIVLRYQLEQAMIEGDLKVKDLPDAWRDGMQSMLAIRPKTDRVGVLQDIHWPVGAIGYFPSYTVGAILGAQLFKAAKVALPGLLDFIEEGDFAPLMGWLQKHVHGLGSSVDFDGLVQGASGKALSTDDFFEHLQSRYDA